MRFLISIRPGAMRAQGWRRKRKDASMAVSPSPLISDAVVGGYVAPGAACGWAKVVEFLSFEICN
jgi:hypothetical protein